MAMKKSASLAEQLRALTEAAPALRAAGVTSVTVDGVSATLAPPEEEPPEERPAPPEVMLGNPDDFFGDRRKGAS